MYRYHPQTTLARSLVAGGAIGELRHVRAALTVTTPAGDIRNNRSLGGGALNDLGCYCTSAMRVFAGSPESLPVAAVPEADLLDRRMSALLRFAGDVTGQFDIALDLPRRDELELIGSTGVITLSDPWICRSTSIRLRTADGVEEIPISLAAAGLTDAQSTPGTPEFDDAVYRIEFDQVSAAFANGTPLPFGRADGGYGFSCMGYELAGPWGASFARAQTHPDGVVTTMLGDGSYLMLNSDLFSAAFAGHPFVAVVCDNGGYTVIDRLQTNQGAAGFNNLYVDCEGPGAKQGGVRVDFAAHAAALGCLVEDVPEGSTLDAVRVAYARAKAAAVRERRPDVLLVRTHPGTWTESGAWWEVGVPADLAGRPDYETGKAQQQRWLRS